MAYETKMPTQEELGRLSDAELSDYAEQVLQGLFKAARQGENTDAPLQIYLIYEAERYRRGTLLEPSP